MKHSKALISSPQRGSTLVVVIVMTMAAGIIAGSLLSYARTEARINQSDLLYNEARLAAESTLQHGMAQLRRRFDSTRQISPSEMEPQRSSSLQLAPGFLSFAASTRMEVPSTYTRPASLSAFLSQPTIMGGVVVNGGNSVNLLIDPSTPLPQDGRPGVPTSTGVREVRVIAKATVSDDSLGSKAAYAEQTFQVLDRSLFQNTAWSNGLLEIFPGANMNLGTGGGPIYAAEVRIGNGVRVHTRIESAGGFEIGRYHSDADQGDTVLLTDFRRFDGSMPSNPNSVDYLASIWADYAGSSVQVQTGQAGFRELALQTYAGGLLTSEHGISSQAAVGLEFLRELALADAADSGINFNDSDGNFDQGIYDRLGGNFGHLLIEPSRGLADLDSAANDEERTRLQALNSVEQNKWSNRSGLALEFDPATETVRMFHQLTLNGEPQFDSVNNQRVRTEIDVDATFPDAEDRFWSVERFSQPGGRNTEVESGLYDFRQARGSDNRNSGRINLLRFDMQKMREWVEEANSDTNFDSEWWNGGVYVKLPENSNPNRDDGVIPAVNNWAIQLHNAKTIPNRTVVDADSPRGLTLATNGALYVQGSYNAPEEEDIDENYGSNVPGSEVPAALVADAIMLLSDNWDNSNSGLSGTSNRPADDTTFSAALVMGNAPSDQGAGTYSGGLENFPRFLERWSGKDVTYRGSLIRLFRSESFAERWGYGNVYNAPNRNWSFHSGFREFSPPLDTGPRSFRRVYFRELTEQEFNSRAAQLYSTTSP